MHFLFHYYYNEILTQFRFLSPEAVAKFYKIHKKALVSETINKVADLGPPALLK